VPATIFLDHAAGSPLRAEIRHAVTQALEGLPPNPSGSHRMARATRSVLEGARERVAKELDVAPDAVLFTSGGTEACNLALRAHGAARKISSIEHVAVREAAGEHVELAVGGDGVLDVAGALEAIDHGDLVSVMAANNETGVLQPLRALSEGLGDRRQGIILHSDAVGSGWCHPLAETTALCDVVSIAAHKLGGPAGSGAVIVADPVALAPLLVGGGQERGLRAGTQDVAGALGLALALELASDDRRRGAVAAMGARRDELEALLGAIDGVAITARQAPRLESHLHLTIEGVRSDELLFLLDEAGLCASAGAACASGASRPSHVLEAMGVEQTRARGALRLSLSPSTSDEEVERAGAIIVSAIAQLRR
jgi:cysteine desulfurase